MKNIFFYKFKNYVFSIDTLNVCIKTILWREKNEKYNMVICLMFSMHVRRIHIDSRTDVQFTYGVLNFRKLLLLLTL